MSAAAAGVFYSSADEAPQQGDILLGAVCRVLDEDDQAPERWRVLDEAYATVLPAVPLGHGRMPAVHVAAGRALVMITTHDCGLDKEFNSAVDRLLSEQDQQEGVDVDAVMVRVEQQRALDRNFHVSPLVHPESVQVAGEQVDQGLLMSGRIIGYLPVPELVVDGNTIIPPSVVDLTYRSTLDRSAYTQRLACIGEPARERLRYALARLDVLRTPTLEAELSAVIGQRITRAKVHRKNALVVQLTLEDGSVLELLQKPGSPFAGPVSRGRGSVSG